MFGRYETPVSLDSAELKILLEERGENLLYRREGPRGENEVWIATPGHTLVVSPIEPLTLPREGIAHHLEITFPVIVLPPAATYHSFLKMPVEVGIFVEKNGVPALIDRINLAPVKYSLYGDPEKGVITRLYRSPHFMEVPSFDPLREGIISLTIVNTSSEYVRASRVVVGENEICLWYDQVAAMTMEMRILSPGHAEVSVRDHPLRPGMVQGIEYYNPRKVAVMTVRSCLMEHGVT